MKNLDLQALKTTEKSGPKAKNKKSNAHVDNLIHQFTEVTRKRPH